MFSESLDTALRRRSVILFLFFVLIALVALVASLGYYFGQKQAPSHALPQSAQSGVPGHKAADPYLAGPLKNTLRKNASALQQPWLQYLNEASAKPEGRIELDWHVDAEGKPSRVSVISSDFQNSQFESGLMRVIEQMSFPPAGQAQRYVSHTFVFKREAQ